MKPTWVLFGAFDRHNFGDLMLPHVVQALLPGHRTVCAGLVEADLRELGGHRVAALAEVARSVSPQALLHVGGEVLTCSAWTAAAMLLPPDEAGAAIAYLERDAAVRDDWVRRRLGTDAPAPYAAGASFFARPLPVGYLAVGGAAFDHAEAALRDAVLARLRAATVVSVRDRHTRDALRRAGIEAALLPDAATMVAELFRDAIAERAHGGEVAGLAGAFEGGYLALQLSAEFGDDATLDALAAQLRPWLADREAGCVLLRAAAAPWHDDAGVLQRLALRLAPRPVRIFASLNVWDLCALMAGSRAVVASSLHVRIVAMAFARPGLTLRSPVAAPGPGKHEAYLDTWEAPGLPQVVPVGGLADGLARALAADPALRAGQGRRSAACFRSGLQTLVSALDRAR